MSLYLSHSSFLELSSGLQAFTILHSSVSLCSTSISAGLQIIYSSHSISLSFFLGGEQIMFLDSSTLKTETLLVYRLLNRFLIPEEVFSSLVYNLSHLGASSFRSVERESQLMDH